MYINKSKKIKCAIVGETQLMIGLISAIIALGGILEVIGNDKTAKSIWGFFVFLAVIAPLLLYLATNNLIAAFYCTRLELIFSQHPDRVITVEEIAAKMNSDKMLKFIQLMIRKRCLINVSLSYAGTKPIIVLEDRTGDENGRRNNLTEYIVVICPNCGSNNSVKKGSVANCRFCGQYIQGKR